jgi:serine/threonine protein kinase
MGAQPIAIPQIPSRIGPYRIIARIASGGMAEIYLAKLSGAAGFERAVVIKRMLPHLVDQPELRATLLDEARIMSRLRHPNIVQVQELAQDRETFYLVMEYLRGDNLSGLMRQLKAQKERLDPVLAIHLVAEMCAGLHVAHELTDEDGRLLNVVHRDVSPQNVFVSFDGEVKMLDFGIARFEDRESSRTKTGICKGKFAYMAPEQFTGATIDRRVDIFALGVILHELLSGQRLFARESEMQTLRAILDTRYPTPSELGPGLEIPEALEAICMRALAREPEDRYPTAEALRIALRELLPIHDPKQEARESLIALMKEAMPDRLAETQDLMRRAREDQTPAGGRSRRSSLLPPPLELARLRSSVPPSGDVETRAERPGLASGEMAVEDVDRLEDELERHHSVDGVERNRRDRREERYDGDACEDGDDDEQRVAELGASPRAVIIARTERPPASTVDRPTAIGRPLAARGGLGRLSPPHALAMMLVLAGVTSVALVTNAVMPRATADRAEGEGTQLASAISPTIRLHVESAPAGAQVIVAGEVRGVTPLGVELDRSAREVDISLELEGHAREVLHVVPEMDQRLVVQLDAVEPEVAAPEVGPADPPRASTWQGGDLGPPGPSARPVERRNLSRVSRPRRVETDEDRGAEDEPEFYSFD